VLQGGFPTQSEVSVAEPGQDDPVPDGAGLLQIRDLDTVPAPQVVLHGVKLDHCPQLPLTFGAENVIISFNGINSSAYCNLNWLHGYQK